MEKNKEKFLEKSKKIHNNKYDYSLVEYKGDKIKVKIICPIHGMFEQEPHNHLKYGCFKCGVENSTKSRYYSTKEYIKKAIEIHGYKYDYSKTVYKKHDDKVIIICKEHGEFLQVARTHIKGSNCPKCVSNANMTTEKFIKKAMDAHKDKYNYSLVECNISSQKVKIICPLHGEFEQVAHNHLKGAGCPHCNESKGEIKIKKFLNDLKIQYETQKKFLECKHKGLLPFDFFISSFNTCIEYDGIQHFKPIKIFGGEKAFEELKIRDKIKTEFCLKNNIKLLRIKYNENVENKIKSFLH